MAHVSHMELAVFIGKELLLPGYLDDPTGDCLRAVELKA